MLVIEDCINMKRVYCSLSLGRILPRFLSTWFLFLAFVGFLLIGCEIATKEGVAASTALEQQADSQDISASSDLTGSPRQTLATFLRLRDEMEADFADYEQRWDFESMDRVYDVLEELRLLIDLSSVPNASRLQNGNRTVAYLLDVLGRVDLPDLKDVPHHVGDEKVAPTQYRIPSTPLRIVKVESGLRVGEFLFSPQTIQIAPRFYRKIQSKPLRTSLPIDSWTKTLPQLTGPLIPLSFVISLPPPFKVLILGTPLWKIMAVFLIVGLTVALLFYGHRVLMRLHFSSTALRMSQVMLTPIVLLIFMALLVYFFKYQLVIAGPFRALYHLLNTILFYCTLAWGFWQGALSIFDTVVVDPRFPDESLDLNLFRLIARIVAVVGSIIILAYGLQELGVPIVSLVTGLGIGGLAIALAIRPTLENLIGGFILFADKPVKVGDYCEFGDKSGTVEEIGVRSTQIRSLDRTLISIPNSQFVDMELINWARCDQMLINQQISLRYETDSDQLRFVLAKVREMFHSHPRIDPETIRVRFSGYGSSSLDIDLRVYAKTREWNDFFAIKEDVLLRIGDIVKQSGTSFAFPSQTIYLGKDEGTDEELGEKAKQEVRKWRRSRQFPFPRFAVSKLEQLRDKLHYPPTGSPDFLATEEELSEGGEQLSAEPLNDESSQ